MKDPQELMLHDSIYIKFKHRLNESVLRTDSTYPGGWTATGVGTRGAGAGVERVGAWGVERVGAGEEDICFLICWLNRVFSFCEFIDL